MVHSATLACLWRPCRRRWASWTHPADSGCCMVASSLLCYLEFNILYSPAQCRLKFDLPNFWTSKVQSFSFVSGLDTMRSDCSRQFSSTGSQMQQCQSWTSLRTAATTGALLAISPITSTILSTLLLPLLRYDPSTHTLALSLTTSLSICLKTLFSGLHWVGILPPLWVGQLCLPPALQVIWSQSCWQYICGETNNGAFTDLLLP